MMNTYSGTIIEGSKKARELGFPTVNIACDENVSGIYAGEVSIDGATYQAAIFADTHRKLLEAYLLNFAKDVYGKTATFVLHKKLREHESTTDTERLKALIARDVEKTRAYFISRA